MQYNVVELIEGLIADVSIADWLIAVDMIAVDGIHVVGYTL